MSEIFLNAGLVFDGVKLAPCSLPSQNKPALCCRSRRGQRKDLVSEKVIRRNHKDGGAGHGQFTLVISIAVIYQQKLEGNWLR